jgi:outer membrane protein
MNQLRLSAGSTAFALCASASLAVARVFSMGERRRKDPACVFLVFALLFASVARAQTAGPLPLTLDEATARGLDASHRIEESAARRDAAAAIADERHAASLPKFDLLAGYTRTNHVDNFVVPYAPPNGFLVVYPDVPNNYSTRLNAQFPLYTGGRLDALERAAGADRAASVNDIEALRADIKVDIARAFWNLVAATDALAVLDESLTQVDAHVRDTRNRLDAGLIPPNDVLSAEAQQSRERMLRIQAAGGRDVAEAALARLVGLPPGTTIRPVLPDAPPPSAERFDDLLTAARINRSDRKALADRAAAAGARGEAAAAGKRPTVSVGGGFDYARPNVRIFPRKPEWNTSWDAGMNVSWPIFDGGRTGAETAEAAANSRAAEARLAEFDTQLALELRQRLTEIETSRAALAAANDTIRAATEASRVVNERFAAGVATNTDVLDAQTDIVRAGLDRTQAIAALRTAQAGLDRAVGR